MRVKYFLFMAVVFLAVSSCATSPLGRKQLVLFGDQQLEEMALQSFDDIKKEKTIVNDPKITHYVMCVAKHIIAEIGGGEWEVRVFDDEDANAFALPGGKIGVHTGIFKVAKNQDQLAAVMAHEVTHVLSKHGNERASQEMVVQTGLQVGAAVLQTKTQYASIMMSALGLGAEVGILLPYSRIHETEADLYGMDLMARAGFNPKAAVDLWLNMQNNMDGNQPPAFLSTHPSHETRMSDLNKRLNSSYGLYQQAKQQGKNPQCNAERN